jgi:stage II sporulation protein GA (sporulation sigma-E factor processing peptidase)
MENRLATLFLNYKRYTESITCMGGFGMDISMVFAVFLHFLVDFLLIVGANSVSGYPLGAKRAALASLVGATYIVLCLLPSFWFLKGNIWRIMALVCISLVAFGWSRDAARRAGLFILLSLALEGITLGLGNDGIWSLLMGAVAVVLLCLFGFRVYPGKQHYVSVRIYHGNKKAELTALVDTGNSLRDPVSGAPVLVVDHMTAEQLLGMTIDQLSKPIETLASGKYQGLRLIPYTSVGQPAGMMLGLRVDRLLINGKEEKMIVAFAPQQIGRDRHFQALAGVTL